MRRDRQTIPEASRLDPTVAGLYAGFLFTGATTVLLGLLVPRLAALHHLSDGQCGALLMTQFAGSASGALLVRRRFERTLMRGYALMGAAALLLIAAQGLAAAAAVALFGLGLGMAMTSTSMLVGRMFPEARGSALSLANFCWSGGALLCPLLVARLPGRFAPDRLCIHIAILSAAFALVGWKGSFPAAAPEAAFAGEGREPRRSVIVLFAALAFLYVGIESTIGGWMSAYASRAAAWDFTRGNLAAACFWGALLLGRAAAPAVLRAVSEAKVYLLSIAGALAGILVLLAAHGPILLLAGAGCTGLALAPIFPLTIALFLRQAGESRNAGWVFAIAGFGGAVLPWLTGMVSTHAGSLRAGLLVTLVADAGMFLLALAMTRLPGNAGARMATADA